MDDEADVLDRWIGRPEECVDGLCSFRASALAGLLGRQPVGDGEPLPLLWHWLFAVNPPTSTSTGTDGHPARGGFLPPVPLPRRMWAGSDIEVGQPLILGSPAVRRSTIKAIERKRGRTGPLVFVTVEHIWSQRGSTCLTERQQIVYRGAAATAAAVLAASAPLSDRSNDSLHVPDHDTLQATILPDEVMLFRYSALTYNAHRIHYDLPYARDVEGYPALVVHGPLVATLLIDVAGRVAGDRSATGFSFKAVGAAFAGRQLNLHATENEAGLALWSTDSEGQVGVRAQLDLTERS